MSQRSVPTGAPPAPEPTDPFAASPAEEPIALHGTIDLAGIGPGALAAMAAGTGGGDTIDGTDGADTLNGLGGDDTINGRGGNDRIYGGADNDTLFGCSGADRLFGGDGVNTLYGGNGKDTFRAGSGVESFYGGTGSDFVNYRDSAGGVSVDLLADTVTGGAATGDLIHSIERVAGSMTGGDTLLGSAGANTLKGFGGSDYLEGRAGADLLFGGAGDDAVYGGAGNDTLIAGTGAETMTGGSGVDKLSYYNSKLGVTIDIASNATSGGWAADDTISGFENLGGSNGGNDTLKGTAGNNVIQGFMGNDTIFSRGGTDTVFGGKGADALNGGKGADALNGGKGADTLDGGRGNDRLFGGDGADVFTFWQAKGRDTVMDFANDQDTIAFSGFSYLATANDALAFATQVGNDVRFDFGADGSLLVRDATLAQIGNDIDIV